MEFQSHTVVTSQSMKKIGGSHPLLLCLQTSNCPTLLKQLWYVSVFMCLFVCLFVCLCVCGREREREREKDRDKEGLKVSKVLVWMTVKRKEKTEKERVEKDKKCTIGVHFDL